MDTAKIIQPKKLSLAKSLRISYMNSNDMKKRSLKKYGYRLDEDLSSHNQTVAYNPSQKKLIQATAGSHNFSDAVTDLSLALGSLKNTTRFKEAETTLKKAKEKYNDRNSTVLTGESLGGTITGYLPYDDKTRAFAVNAGYTIGQKARDRDGRLSNYRIKGDIVSLLGSRQKNMTTLSGLPIKKSNSALNYIIPYDIHLQKTKGSGIMV